MPTGLRERTNRNPDARARKQPSFNREFRASWHAAGVAHGGDPSLKCQPGVDKRLGHLQGVGGLQAILKAFGNHGKVNVTVYQPGHDGQVTCIDHGTSGRSVMAVCDCSDRATADRDRDMMPGIVPGTVDEGPGEDGGQSSAK